MSTTSDTDSNAKPTGIMCRLETVFPNWTRRLEYYGLALLFVAAAVTLRWELREVLRPAPTLVFYLAWVGAAAFGGLGPGLLATVASALCIDFLFDPTPGQISFTDPMALARLLILLTGGLVVSVVGEKMRRARLRQHRQMHELADLTQALRRSEERLHLAMESGKVGVWEWELGKEEVQWSQGAKALLGYEPGALPSTRQAFRQCIHPEDRARHDQAMRQALERREDYFCQFRVVWPDGSLHWVEARGQYAYPSGTGATGTVWMRGVLADIDRRKQAEEMLHAKEAELELILTETPFMLTRCSRDLHYRYVSRAYAEMIGRTPDQVAGKPIIEIMGAEGFEAIRPHVEAVLRGQPVEYEASVPYRDVGARFVRVAYVPDRDEQGHVIGWIASILDVTERRQAEEALRQSERRFKSTFENAAIGIAHVALDGHILQFNHRFCEIAGYLPDDVMGKTCAEITFADDWRSEQVQMQRLVEGQVDHYSMEKRYVRADGRPVWVNLTRSIQGDETGKAEYFITLVEDISERKRAEEALRELTATLENRVAQRTAELRQRTRQLQKLALDMSETEDRERERLAHVLHDDLQQELAAAKFHLSIVRSRVKYDASLQEITMTVEEMLKDAIAKSRSLSHELSPVVLRQNDFAEILRWLANEMQAKHGLTVRVQGEASLQSDPLKVFLYRTAQELLFNAVKHAQVNEAKVRVWQCGGCICLSVSDHGRGFDPGQPREAAGFGLLSIRERIELLGGRMKIRSAPGKGSTFFVIVPSGETVGEWTGRVKGAERGSAAAPRRLRVLLADDHEVVRQGLASLLREEERVEVVGEATNGREAVELAGQLHPDVVVMDVLMPVMNGDEATRRIKKDLPQTRIVSLSMREESEIQERMCQAGAESYVLKTAPYKELLAAIRGESQTDNAVRCGSTT